MCSKYLIMLDASRNSSNIKNTSISSTHVQAIQVVQIMSDQLYENCMTCLISWIFANTTFVNICSHWGEVVHIENRFNPYNPEHILKSHVICLQKVSLCMWFSCYFAPNRRIYSHIHIARAYLHEWCHMFFSFPVAILHVINLWRNRLCGNLRTSSL